MTEIATDELDAMLDEMKPTQITHYYEKNSKYLADGKAFYYYMKDVLEEKNILLKDIYSFAGVSESWGSKIISMERHTKNRDLILRFCFAGHLSLTEVNRALKLYGMSPLYSKDRRDVCLIVSINNRKYDLAEVDEILINQGFEKLSITE